MSRVQCKLHARIYWKSILKQYNYFCNLFILLKLFPSFGCIPPHPFSGGAKGGLKLFDPLRLTTFGCVEGLLCFLKKKSTKGSALPKCCKEAPASKQSNNNQKQVSYTHPLSNNRRLLLKQREQGKKNLVVLLEDFLPFRVSGTTFGCVEGRSP